jgi:hypothetical protein
VVFARGATTSKVWAGIKRRKEPPPIGGGSFYGQKGTLKAQFSQKSEVKSVAGVFRPPPLNVTEGFNLPLRTRSRRYLREEEESLLYLAS